MAPILEGPRRLWPSARSLAGMAFSNVGVAVVGNALEIPRRPAPVHCSHGAGNGLLLPYVMRFNLTATAEKRFAEIATLLGEKRDGPRPTEPAAAEKAVTGRLERLRDDIGVPARLRRTSAFKPEQLRSFARESVRHSKRILRVNPRSVHRGRARRILKEAY